MIRKIIPFFVPVVALLGGAFAGDMLQPASATAPPDAAMTDDAGGTPDHAATPDAHGETAAGAAEEAWFTFPSQFFVPLMRQGDLRDMMILTLSLQTNSSSLEELQRKEHALRDALLRQLMIHANTGGFDGNFTADRNLSVLRDSLLKAAKDVTDQAVGAVLIEDIARQAG